MRLQALMRLLSIAALALLLAPARPGHGQGAPPPNSGGWAPRRAVQPGPGLLTHMPVTGTQRVLLPLIVTLPSVVIQFGSGVDSQNNLIDPGTTFTYGITHLYYRYTVAGAAGLPYRTEWSVDGAGQPQLDDSGTIPSASSVFTNFLCSPTLGSCGQPVPRGAYQVKFFINGLFYEQVTAVVH